jgi:hypothetical protein
LVFNSVIHQFAFRVYHDQEVTGHFDLGDRSFSLVLRELDVSLRRVFHEMECHFTIS